MKNTSILFFLLAVLTFNISNSQCEIGKQKDYNTFVSFNQDNNTFEKIISKSDISFESLSTDIPDNYTYDQSFTYSFVSTDKKNTSEMTIEYSFPKSGDFLCMSMGNLSTNGKQETMGLGMEMIMDFKLNKMITVMKAQNMVMVMSMDPFETLIDDSVEESQENQTFNKTGETKTILGYSCDEYEYSDGDFTGISWISEDPTLSLSDMFGSFQNTPNNPFKDFKSPKSGTLMEMHLVSKNGKEKTDMTLVDISKAGGTISLEGMQVLALPGQ